MKVNTALLVDLRTEQHVEVMLILDVEQIVECVRPSVVGVVGLT